MCDERFSLHQITERWGRGFCLHCVQYMEGAQRMPLFAYVCGDTSYQMRENEPANRPTYLFAAGVISLLIALVILVAGMAHFGPSEWGAFGDFVSGSAGVILTTLSFLALLYTIHIQSTELGLSRQELALTRAEMALNRGEVAKSAEALSEQVKAVGLQNFERTLFESLGFLSGLVEQFEFKSPVEDHPRKGVQAFFSMYHLLGHDTVNLGGIASEDGNLVGAHPPLNQILDRLSLMLASYFRTLYNIYRFVDDSPYSEIEYYNRIIRAQMPDHALVILFYNSLTDRGKNFQKYIVKYEILDNMPRGLLFHPFHGAILDNLPTEVAA